MQAAKTWDEMPVAFCGSAILLSSFCIVYSMGVLFPRIQNDLGIPPWHLPAFFSAAGAIYFGIGTFSGPLTDRFGARGVIWAGQTIMASGMLVASTACTEEMLAAGYITGVGLGVGLTYVPVTSAVQSLCPKRGTLAASIAATGIGIGALLMPPAVAAVSAAYGWRSTVMAMAAIALIAPLAAIPLRNAAAASVAAARPYRRNRLFITLYIAQLLAAAVAFVPFAHLVGLALANGLSLSAGVALLSSVGIGSIVGRVGTGLTSARIGIYRTAAICSAAMAAAMLALAVSRELPNMAASMLVFGIGYGGFNSLLGPITVETCGRANIGRTMGILVTSRAIGMLAGPWLVGFGAWRLGGYSIPLIGCAGCAAVSALLLSRMVGPQRFARAMLSIPAIGLRPDPVGSKANIQPQI